MLGDHVAVCYSGYRAGQSPDEGRYPGRDQVLEDLRLVARSFREIRLYDAGPHAELVLDVIESHGIGLTVLLGAWLDAEASNPGCPWGGEHPESVLARNRLANEAEIARAAALANRYPSIVTAVSAGNEAAVSWTDHLVPTPRIIEHVRALKSRIAQPVTFCDNHVPWLDRLQPLVAELDFVSVHSYPAWEDRTLDEAIGVTDADHRRIAERYPGVRIAITEAGWPTRSNGRGIAPERASEEAQRRYVTELCRWAGERGVMTYLFEAFDEPWKGSPDPDEPEKHWGLFTETRRPKPVLHDRYPELAT